MNQTQRNYCIARAKEIARDKKTEARRSVTWPIELNALGKYELIKSGKVKMKKPTCDSFYSTEALFDFSKQLKARRVKMEECQTVVETLWGMIDLQQRLIVDEIMIGDCKKAMDLLDKFSKMKF